MTREQDVLEYQERRGLTIWGDSISAQMRSGEEPMVICIQEGAPRSSEDGHPVILTERDVAKLRELLNEAASRHRES